MISALVTIILLTYVEVVNVLRPTSSTSFNIRITVRELGIIDPKNVLQITELRSYHLPYRVWYTIEILKLLR